MKKLKTPLSNYLPTAIRQAVTDVIACNKDPHFEITMWNWYSAPYDDGRHVKCGVCVAGATLVRRTDFKLPDECSLLKDLDRDLPEQGFTENQIQMLYALDNVRTGNILGASLYTGLEEKHEFMSWSKFYGDRRLTFNHKNTQPWVEVMLEMADFIEQNTQPSCPQVKSIP